MEVTVDKEITCPVDSQKVIDAVKAVLEGRKAGNNSQVEVVIVGRDKMQALVSDYLKDGEDHPVLSFPAAEAEGEFTFPPDGLRHLGEIVISYPWAQEQARVRGENVESIVCDLAKHGALHLLGVHHD